MPTEIGTKLVSKRFGNEAAKTLAGYEADGGYQPLRKALAMRPEDITAEVKASNLRGRGGAGFATGVKWGFVPKDAKQVHLVCNADESEPGTCKDRELMYWDPHLLIEGMIIAAHALKAVHNFIYIRGEMMREYLVLQKAVEEAYARGYLGKNILGTSIECHLTVHRGAGAYICGEETALLNSLEGLRGQALDQREQGRHADRLQVHRSHPVLLVEHDGLGHDVAGQPAQARQAPARTVVDRVVGQTPDVDEVGGGLPVVADVDAQYRGAQ